ncbi:MAG: hypothetical protein PHR35_13810 [Kiritimatiellae bacterium]|nr:hypothetical protein [Kiritimatiellia bacterium]
MKKRAVTCGWMPLLLLFLGAIVGRAESLPPYYGDLAGYGTWFTISGAWVWQPEAVREDAAWRPYFTAGCWQREADGWFWASDYPWGAVVFHRGRWYASPANGWVWVPGTDWSPAWVTWGLADGAYGWAPQPPEAEFFARIAVNRYELQWPHYMFVPHRNFLSRDLRGCAVDGSWYAGTARAVTRGPAPGSVGWREIYWPDGVTDSTTVVIERRPVFIDPPVVYVPPHYRYGGGRYDDGWRHRARSPYWRDRRVYGRPPPPPPGRGDRGHGLPQPPPSSPRKDPRSGRMRAPDKDSFRAPYAKPPAGAAGRKR